MLHLPRQSSLEPLGDVDLDFLTKLVYNPITGTVYRRRYRMGLSLIESSVDSILEIGYGAGLILPSLRSRCSRLYAVDIHDKIRQVEKMLKRADCDAELRVGSITDLPYKSRFFDLIVCLSVLEHLEPFELSAAMAEMRRTLRPDGYAILGFPAKNRLTNLLFRLVGFDDDKGHPSDHRSIIAKVKRNFSISKIKRYPPILPLDYGLYTVLKCTV